MSSNALPSTRLEAIARPLTVCQEGDALHMVLEPLQHGAPVALRQHEEWFLLSPQQAAGQPPSRRLIDLPLQRAPLLPPSTSCAEALRHIHGLDNEFLLVGEQDQLLGYVPLSELLLHVLRLAEQGGLAWQFLDAILSFASVLIWQLPLPSGPRRLAQHLPNLRIWGPLQSLTGYTPQDLLHHLSQGLDLLHPEDTATFTSAAKALAKPGGSVDQVIRFRHQSGKWIWLRLQIFSEAEANGGMHLRGIASDMTPIIAMQDRLQETEQLYQTLAEETPAGVAIVTEQDLLYVNRALAQALGLLPQDVVRKADPLKLVHPEDRPQTRDALLRLLHGEIREVNLTFRIRPIEGAVRYIEAHARRIRHHGQRAALVSMNDVTERILEQKRGEILAAIHKALSLRAPRQALQEAMATIGQHLPLDAANLLLTDGRGRPQAIPQWVRPEASDSFAALMEALHGKESATGHSVDTLLQKAASDGSPYYVPDTQRSKNEADALRASRGWRTFLGLPLILEREYQAFLCLYARAPNALGESQRALLEELRPTFAAAVQSWRYEQMLTDLNKELEARVQRRTYELQVLHDLSHKIGYTLDYDDLMRLMLEHLHRAVSHDVAASLLIMGDTSDLHIRHARPITPQLIAQIRQTMLADLSQRSGRDLAALPCHQHAQQAAQFEPQDAPLSELGASFSVPLEVAGKCIGLIFVGSRDQGALGPDDERLLRTLAAEASLSIERLRALLDAEHRRLETLVADLPIGVLMLDEEQRILVANAAARRMLHELEAPTKGERLQALGCMSMQHILDRISDPLPMEIRTPGPPPRIFALRGGPIRRGETQQWILTLQDISAERSAQEKLASQERLATVGQLAAGIAHDFNNIIGAIMLYADLLLAEAGLPERVYQRADIIKTQSQQAATLTQQILDFGRKSIIALEPMDLSRLLQEIAQLLRRVLPETIHLEVVTPGEDCLINGDPNRLQQVFMNLAINARDAMPEGGLLHLEVDRLEISPNQRPPFRDMEPGAWIRIHARDSGSGISPEVLPHIFEPFFTTKEAGKGSGLGLAQVYGIVKQHGGYIDVESTPGKGTTFIIYLPALSTEVTQAKPLDDTAVAAGQGETILVVEDHPANRRALRDMLQGLQYRVLEASDGFEALKIIRQHQAEIDLVLSDLVMPRMDGRVLHAKLRAEYPQIKMVIMTGYPLATKGDTAMLRALPWIQKPVHLPALSQAIRRALDRDER